MFPLIYGYKNLLDSFRGRRVALPRTKRKKARSIIRDEIPMLRRFKYYAWAGTQRRRKKKSMRRTRYNDIEKFGFYRGFHSVFSQPSDNNVKSNVSRSYPLYVFFITVELRGVGYSFMNLKQEKSGEFNMNKSVDIITSGTSSTRISLEDFPMDGTLDFKLSNKDPKKLCVIYGTVPTSVNEFARDFACVNDYNPYTKQGILVSHIKHVEWKEFVKNPDNVFSVGHNYDKEMKIGYYENEHEFPLHPSTFELPYAFPDEVPVKYELPFTVERSSDVPHNRQLIESIIKYAKKMEMKDNAISAVEMNMREPAREYAAAKRAAFSDISTRSSKGSSSFGRAHDDIKGRSTPSMKNFFVNDSSRGDVVDFMHEEIHRKELPARYDPYTKRGGIHRSEPFGFESGVGRSVPPRGMPRDNLNMYRLSKHNGLGNGRERGKPWVNPPTDQNASAIRDKSRFVKNRRGPFR